MKTLFASRRGPACGSALAAALLVLVLHGAQGLSQVSVTTYHNDSLRSGQNLHETVLTHSLVNLNTFGKLFAQPVDGQIYAQPLVVSNLQIAGKGKHTVVYVATENDSVYAFDGNSNTGTNANPLWQVSFVNPAQGITTVPASDFGTTMITPQIGITGTPVIDVSNQTLYVVAATKENGAYYQRLHALDIATGAEKFGGPVVISAVVKGTGANSVKGYVYFDPFRSNQRAALLLVNGFVYIAWASHGFETVYPYHGWIMAYNESTLKLAGAFCITPHGDQGGVWQSGSGPAAATFGHGFFMVGNGTFVADTGGTYYGMSNMMMSAHGGLKVTDYFTPYNQAQESFADLDLGSGGALLFPYQSGSSHPYLGVGAGKDGSLYLVNRQNMGGFNSKQNLIVQQITNAFAGHTVYSSPAYWQGYIYYFATYRTLRLFRLNKQVAV